MDQCTCTKDREITCIVHPTARALHDYIAELEAEQHPHFLNWCEELQGANTRLEAENAKLEYRLWHTHKECETCTMTVLDTTGLNICDGCGQKIWEGEK